MAKDKISTLPDDILCHILSFLQTKESNATTILSKRWKHLWRSVTTLRIDSNTKNLKSNTDFINIVHSVLLSRHPALPIKTFHLQFKHNYKSLGKNLTNCVNFVVQRGVECLDLDVPLAKLPITVLTCKTLVVLKLSSFRVEKGFYDILLPSLKTCHLKLVKFPKLQDFIMFLTGCPMLQNLRSNHVDFDHRESLTCNEWKGVLLSNLIRAKINCIGCYFPLKAVHNVPSLRLIYSPHNQQRYYNNDFIPTFYNLTQLELLCLDYSKEFILDVLNRCPKLQRLDLTEIWNCHTYARKNDKTNWIFPDVVPQCLSLNLRTCNLLDFRGLHGELMLASYILKNASVLQTMKIWNVGKPGIKRILSAVPMASSMCKLTVYNDPCN